MPTTLAPARSALGTPDDSELVLHRADELIVIQRLQRKPRDHRLKQVARDWDPAQEGILFVAKITDGDNAGVLHVYDGGTRWAAQMQYGGPDLTPNPDYVFVCWVREMTEHQAAQAFIAFNTEARRPSAFYQYQVGLEAGTDWALAIQCSVAELDLGVAESATENKVAAISAARRVVEKARIRALRDGSATTEEEAWAAGCAHLVAALDLCRKVQGSDGWTPGDVWHADFVQATASMLALNPGGPHSENRWKQTVSVRSLQQWIAIATAVRSTGGSESRSLYLRTALIDAYNGGVARRGVGRALAESARLAGGTPPLVTDGDE